MLPLKSLAITLVVIVVAYVVVRHFYPQIGPKVPYIDLEGHEEEEEEEMDDMKKVQAQATEAQAKKIAGETDPKKILAGVKRSSVIQYPESSRTIADSLYGVNNAQGICGRDTESNLDAALSRAKEGYKNKDCRVNRYYNMPAHLEDAILGKVKVY